MHGPNERAHILVHPIYAIKRDKIMLLLIKSEHHISAISRVKYYADQQSSVHMFDSIFVGVCYRFEVLGQIGGEPLQKEELGNCRWRLQ